mmetsp:Transcript_27576/g.85803  ORF Transcript_27576/g.85803 Transcript_27576/m.85803 type:complete len:425 (-) Transcript_27576:87-1361(-)
MALHRQLAGQVLAALLLRAGAISRLHASARAGELEAAEDTFLRTCTRRSMSFEAYVQKFGRDYVPGSEEYLMRQRLYEGRVPDIDGHNCGAKGERPWKATVNRLTDWTPEELQSLRGYRGHRRSAGRVAGLKINFAVRQQPEEEPLPGNWSWANLSTIQEPRDQGQCGSCWAFASHTTMRAHAEIVRRPVDFSVSQVISCTPNPQACGGAGGCNGATAELAFDYVLRAGLARDADLRYPRGGGEVTCPEHMKVAESAHTKGTVEPDGTEVHRSIEEPNMQGLGIGMVGWTKFPENKEQRIVRSLVQEGPVTVAVAAGSEWNWYWYGILTPQGCDPNNVISHAVVLFGYGEEKGTRYWHIKNSWGLDWGEQGNLRLQRLDDEEAHCGWDNQPELGSGCKGGPPRVWVCGSCGILYDAAIPNFVAA